MKYFIPSYEEARAICDAYDNFQFYESIKYVDGYKICTFNYRLVSYGDFNLPIKDKPAIKAFELRGLCFVFNKDGSLYKRYLLMNKFFNVNENESTQLEAIKHIPIKTVEDKLDGSLISFIKLPNDKIYAKSKMILDSDQAIAAQEIYENNNNIKILVENLLHYNLVPLFEYISPSNRVVLKYTKSDLVLLKIRDNHTGEYITKNYNDFVKKSELYNYTTWDEILPLRDTLTDKEGFVITLENGMMLKYKLEWYCSRHHLLTETLHREDFLIEKIVNDEIDDIVASIDANDVEILLNIQSIREKIIVYLKSMTELVEQKITIYNDVYKGDKKYFCLKEKKGKVRTMALNVINGKESVIGIIKKDLLQQTYYLQFARNFLSYGYDVKKSLN